jgi:nitrogen regulatory protein PII-like uncharacterized protein
METEFNGKILTITTYMSGEEMTWQHSVSVEAFKKFLSENTNEDAEQVLEDMAEHPVTISLISKEQHREACINGLIWGDGCSRKWAEREVDGIAHPEGVEHDEEVDE